MDKRSYLVDGERYTEEQMRELLFSNTPKKNDDVFEISDTEEIDLHKDVSKRSTRRRRAWLTLDDDLEFVDESKSRKIIDEPRITSNGE